MWATSTDGDAHADVVQRLPSWHNASSRLLCGCKVGGSDLSVSRLTHSKTQEKRRHRKRAGRRVGGALRSL